MEFLFCFALHLEISMWVLGWRFRAKRHNESVPAGVRGALSSIPRKKRLNSTDNGMKKALRP
jgi:hypothetical protein